MFLYSGSVKKQLALEPFCVLDPSKYMYHMSFVQGPLATLVLLSLLLQTTEQVSYSPIGHERILSYVSGGVGDGFAR